MTSRQASSSIDGKPNLLAKYAKINQGTGTAELVAAPTNGDKIRVLGYVVAGSATGTVEFRSDDSTGSLTGVMPILVDSNIVAPYSRAGWFECVADESLDLFTVTASADGHIIYTLV